jgi:hypothetical protein
MDPTRPVVPSARPTRAALPYGDADGAVIPHAGRYARECVLVAFEMIGGVDRMAAWADANPGEFFTKLYPKVITKEVELHASEGIESLLSRLDEQERNPTPAEDADFEVVEE